ncbi:hypothetical protein [Paenibacillus brasilensis]|uniref:Uncharacterized protein n=1 Tax=Paenibacillus brasilensis TaxID=128574 RepID=A0ABU0L4A2_9BACL|nr:hypothetical protein [Paenibacillus brasilensis]MDQ0496113.1 hypothetical protein [Paenibacillus brasilensis]
MDFRNPPNQYDPEAHKRKHEEQEQEYLSGRFSFLCNAVNLLIVVGIFAVIILLIKFF